MPSSLEIIRLETAPNPSASVIWLHGFGADGNDFVPIVPELRLPKTPAIRFLFPHAPLRAITMYGGERVRAWSDIASPGQPDEPGIRASQGEIEALIAAEKQSGIAARRIVLAGFSQGGMIALQTGLRHAERLAGIMGLSTALALPEKLAAERSPANADIPILMAHGEYDAMIPIERATSARSTLESLGYAIEWHDYPMEHSVCPEEIAHISAWLQRVLA
jgi:phospholipase/carboxylesterase